jgi:hypothetical protein
MFPHCSYCGPDAFVPDYTNFHLLYLLPQHSSSGKLRLAYTRCSSAHMLHELREMHRSVISSHGPVITSICVNLYPSWTDPPQLSAQSVLSTRSSSKATHKRPWRAISFITHRPSSATVLYSSFVFRQHAFQDNRTSILHASEGIATKTLPLACKCNRFHTSYPVFQYLAIHP